jgi:hypothetical protein
MIPNAADKFDDQGNLTDKFTEDMIRKLVAALVSWTIRYQAMMKQHAMAA